MQVKIIKKYMIVKCSNRTKIKPIINLNLKQRFKNSICLKYSSIISVLKFLSFSSNFSLALKKNDIIKFKN